MTISRSLLSRKSNSDKTYLGVHQNKDTAFPISSTNKNMEKHLYLKRGTQSIEKWVWLANMEAIKCSTTTRTSREATIITLNKSTDRKRIQLKNHRKVWSSRATRVTMITSSFWNMKSHLESKIGFKIAVEREITVKIIWAIHRCQIFMLILDPSWTEWVMTVKTNCLQLLTRMGPDSMEWLSRELMQINLLWIHWSSFTMLPAMQKYIPTSEKESIRMLCKTITQLWVCSPGRSQRTTYTKII